MAGGVLAERVASGMIRGRLEAGVIYTQAYLQRIKAQLRCAGLAAARRGRHGRALLDGNGSPVLVAGRCAPRFAALGAAAAEGPALLLPTSNAACLAPDPRPSGARCRSGALRGAVSPVAVPSLVRELGIEGLASLNALVPSLVEELAAEGAGAGGGRGAGGQAGEQEATRGAGT